MPRLLGRKGLAGDRLREIYFASDICGSFLQESADRACSMHPWLDPYFLGF